MPMIHIDAYESVTPDQKESGLIAGDGLGHNRFGIDIDRTAVTSIEPFRERGRVLRHYYVVTLVSGNTFIVGDEGRAAILGLHGTPPAE